VKHAGPAALDALDDLLAKLRKHAALREPKRGSFYLKTSAILHFHEDPKGFFADLKIDGEFTRLRVSTAKERAALLRATAEVLAKLSPEAPRSARSPGTRRGA
jgi:hypothetical protein